MYTRIAYSKVKCLYSLNCMKSMQKVQNADKRNICKIKAQKVQI